MSPPKDSDLINPSLSPKDKVKVDEKESELAPPLENHVREHSGMKRAREGSLEPTSNPVSTPLATKKNRLGATPEHTHTERDEDDVVNSSGSGSGGGSGTGKKENETNNVGEVRRKVQEMTWKEGQGQGPPPSAEQEDGKDLKRKTPERNESSTLEPNTSPKKAGVRGLYRGISAPILGAAAENASLFMVYGKCQEGILALSPREGGLGIGELMVAGAGAGAFTSFVLTPIELIKCRMQVQMLTREGAFGSTTTTTGATAAPPLAVSSSTKTTTPPSSRPFSTSSILRQTRPTPIPPPVGPLALITDTIRNQGLRGLWLGQTGTLFRETGGSAAWFGAYELSTRSWIAHSNYTSKADLSALQLMSSGALAGISYNVILFPADSIKSNMQTWAELNPGAARSSFIQTGKNIFRTRGLGGLYAGCGLTCLRSGPSSAMIFLIFQRLEQNFGYIFGLP